MRSELVDVFTLLSGFNFHCFGSLKLLYLKTDLVALWPLILQLLLEVYQHPVMAIDIDVHLLSFSTALYNLTERLVPLRYHNSVCFLLH